MSGSLIGTIILLLIGIAGIGGGIYSKRHKDAMGKTPTVGCGDIAKVAGDQGGVPCEVTGAMEPARGTLTGPFSGAPCLWYRTKVSRKYQYRERSNNGSKMVTKTEKVSSMQSSDAFGVRDISGATWVWPDGANVLGESRTVDRFEPYQSGRGQQAGSGSLAERALNLGMNFLEGSREGTIGYKYEEWVLREGTELYVLGGATRDQASNAWLQKPERGPFLVSTKSEKELTRRASLGTYGGYAVGAAALIGGLVWGVLQLLS